MGTAAKQQAPPGQALERVRPQERALVQAANELGILRESGGALMIDLSSPELAKKYNVLAPAATLTQADLNFTPAISVITLDATPGTGDFYEIEKPKAASGNFSAKPGAYALSKRALDVIGKQAGIEELDPVIQYFGDRHENVRVTVSVRVRRADGTFQLAKGTREWVEEDEKAQLEGSIPEWATRGESARAKWWNDNWYGRVKKFRLPMTESKARLRAYRQVLTLKSKYAPEDLAKPWLVVSTSFTPDTSDPEILRMVFTGGERATDLLYGPAALPAHTDAIEGVAFDHDDAPANVDPETGEVFEGTAAEVEPQGHGERPTEDPIVPEGDHKGKHLSEAIQADRAWGEGIAKSNSGTWGPAAEAWLLHIYGPAEGGENVPF